MSLQFLYRTGCLKLKRHKTTLNIIGSLSLNVSLSCTYLLLSPYSSVAQPISHSLLSPSLMRCCLNNVSFGVTMRRLFAIGSSLEAVGEPTIVKVGQVTEVNKDTFWPIVEAAGEKTVVLNMYTQWSGPCKVIAPRFKELSEKYLNVVFLKLDCNQKNKPLAKELGIRVVPTFKILKDNKIVKEVTRAKFDDLVCY